MPGNQPQASGKLAAKITRNSDMPVSGPAKQNPEQKLDDVHPATSMEQR